MKPVYSSCRCEYPDHTAQRPNSSICL